MRREDGRASVPVPGLAHAPAGPDPVTDPDARRRLVVEIWIVLGLSLLPSTLRAVVTIVNRLTLDTALSEQTATINRPADEREIFDLLYQLISIAASLVPVALALYLLWQVAGSSGSQGSSGTGGTGGSFASVGSGGSPASPFRRIGFDLRRPGRDLRDGVLLAAVIGIPGIGVYLLGRALDLTATVQPSALNDYWWTVPVLLLLAMRAGLIEEVVGVGYLFTRLRQLAWSPWAILITCGLLRGGYHLYQGIGPFFGNVAMGLLFGWLFLRTGRVMPLVIAHFLLDAFVFLGYAWIAGLFPELFGLAG